MALAEVAQSLDHGGTGRVCHEVSGRGLAKPQLHVADFHEPGLAVGQEHDPRGHLLGELKNVGGVGTGGLHADFTVSRHRPRDGFR